jgi:hypothetical protein
MFFSECQAAKVRGIAVDDWFEQSRPSRAAAVACDEAEDEMMRYFTED